MRLTIIAMAQRANAPKYPYLKSKNTRTVHHDPNSHILVIAINASLKRDSVLVIISEIPIITKEMTTKNSQGNGQYTSSLQVFPFKV